VETYGGTSSPRCVYNYQYNPRTAALINGAPVLLQCNQYYCMFT
jgi:hypothetical protein